MVALRNVYKFLFSLHHTHVLLLKYIYFKFNKLMKLLHICVR